MWWKWFPWRFIVRSAARRQGFTDPIGVLLKLQRFSQPSDVLVPTELLRSGVVLHARGLMNSQAIQHNLDWIWPYWVERQYDPRDQAFVPRAFSITQINLTHRNWTAVGLPEYDEYPIVDPRGLVTPFFDSWSIDAWILREHGPQLIPSHLDSVAQDLLMDNQLAVVTISQREDLRINSQVEVRGSVESPQCAIQIKAEAGTKAWLVVSLRPYNPEGVSFINEIESVPDGKGWRINKEKFVHFDAVPERMEYSYYRRGDVYNRLSLHENEKEIFCHVGMATSAALFELNPHQAREMRVTIPLQPRREPKVKHADWSTILGNRCRLTIPDKHFQFLYDAALRTLILHSPKEVYPGPYTYRRFWFRDAAFILYALLCTNFPERVARAIECFLQRQTVNGYFLSQEGEWDSNGEAIWIIRRYCEMTCQVPSSRWLSAVERGAAWITHKRLKKNTQFAHDGLLPAGFSAEHFGPNDFYYWDDFWAVAGLKAAAFLQRNHGSEKSSSVFEEEAEDLLQCIERSLRIAEKRLQRPAMPASPYRRMDGGAIGSISAGYPLQIFSPHDARLLDTIKYLVDCSFVNGGFFHDMTHSGINPYLTLHIAQNFLRAGDARYFELMTAIAQLASSTGQWPEAVHPLTNGGCMGDGQHVWAAAEWVLMIRNCFVREEWDARRLILCSGIPEQWLVKDMVMSFGPAPTSFGKVDIRITVTPDQVTVSWNPKWFSTPPQVDIHLAGFAKITALPNQDSITLNREKRS